MKEHMKDVKGSLARIGTTLAEIQNSQAKLEDKIDVGLAKVGHQGRLSSRIRSFLEHVYHGHVCAVDWQCYHSNPSFGNWVCSGSPKHHQSSVNNQC